MIPWEARGANQGSTRRRSAALPLLLLALGKPAGLARAEEAERRLDDEDRPYTYRSYTEVMRYFEDLKRQCPDILDTWIAQKEFPEIIPDRNKQWGDCEGRLCETLVVRITNRKKLTTTTPEVFFSGALHGDERLGPLVVTELAGFLCRQYLAGGADVRRLLDTRSVWLAPMTNAWGFAHESRAENGHDPNRDFPYLQHSGSCMLTQTARTVNELFRRHLFHFMITFHGGERSLTYEWGSRNHMANSRSTEAPDDRAYNSVGKVLQAVAGEGSYRGQWYPLGRITDVVYAVDGGMEDWSYAAGWEASPTPINQCRPSTYGGYNSSRTEYRSGSVASLVYLAEMDDTKYPSSSTLGHSSEVWSTRSGQGHVARNMRMCLKLIDLARPEVAVSLRTQIVDNVPPGSELSVDVHGLGCLTLSSARLLLVPRDLLSDCASLACALADARGACPAAARKAILDSHEVAKQEGALTCRALAWERVEGQAWTLTGRVPNAAGEFCLVIAAEFDQDWRQQIRPDPMRQPQAHATRVRIDEHYTAEATEGHMRIDEYKTKVFPVQGASIFVAAAAGASPPTSGGVSGAGVAGDAGGAMGGDASGDASVVAAPMLRQGTRAPTAFGSQVAPQVGDTDPVESASVSAPLPETLPAPEALLVELASVPAPAAAKLDMLRGSSLGSPLSLGNKLLFWAALIALASAACGLCAWRGLARRRDRRDVKALGSSAISAKAAAVEVVGRGSATEAEVEPLAGCA